MNNEQLTINNLSGGQLANNSFMLIFRHYLMRALKDPQTVLILVMLPLGIVAITSMIETGENFVNGYNITATFNAVFNFTAFQFFSGAWLIHYLHTDFSRDVRWRLQSAPVSRLTFFFAATAGIWVFTILQGLLIIAVTSVFFNAYWGNPLILAAVLLIISVMAQLVSILIFLFTRTLHSGNAVIMVFIFGMMIISGMMFSLGSSAAAVFLRTHGTPLSLASRAILYSGFILDDMDSALFNIAVLSVIVVVMCAAVVIFGRRRLV